MPTTELSARILIVDDEPALRNGCARVLRGCGADVTIATDGRQAVEWLTEGDFDVALIDMVMPGWGGMTVLEKLAEAQVEAVPIVMTAHATIETAIEAVKRGAFDYLPKPFVPPELIVRVERALRWRELHREADRRLLELDSDKSRLRTIVNSLADGVLVVNTDGTVVLSNPAARAALDVESCGDESVELADFVQDEDLRTLITTACSRGAAAGIGLTAAVERGPRVYMARVVPISSRHGESAGAAAVLRDVTELMDLERAKSQFVSMVAHELKSPLAAVQGFLKVILTGPALPPERLETIVQRCSDRVDGMAQLVRDLLELSQADALPTRRLGAVDAAEVIREAVDQSEHLAAQRSIHVTLDLPTEGCLLQADRDDVFRVVGNLVSNAIKYNRDNGRVAISLAVDGCWVAIQVRDTGLGIPRDAMARLGEEFYRVSTPERRGIVGTGLGLALVKRTMETYHGKLQIESEEGVGSTFTALFPLEAQA